MHHWETTKWSIPILDTGGLSAGFTVLSRSVASWLAPHPKVSAKGLEAELPLVKGARGSEQVYSSPNTLAKYVYLVLAASTAPSQS